ncbi:MAG: hypothetical protein CO108_09010 [Deltaproteobacteria bacterium CG_4_9_14_3_um_filter_63_12]|nr:MAG: hypothetical protein CO108_09010 [Deltaproteobacteria bacterium CG_4_9_14_3_um_filter_63_12]
MKKLAGILFVVALSLAFVACSEETSDPTAAQPKTTVEDGKPGAGKEDAWNYTNDPRRFEVAFEYKYDTLKANTVGRAEQLPWPSDYWATVEDSTNVRYQDQLSPVEKYDQAFNAWVPNMDLKPLDLSADCGMNDLVENRKDDYYAQLGKAAIWQHKNKGNFKARDGVDNDNDGKIDECRNDSGDYDGMESWWGLCHAWVPAAILEPEPAKSVTVNGVEFTVSDIKALMITSYDRSSALMLGGRCNAKEIVRDKDTGRITADECRDTNAGAFYVVITNMLGIRKRAFAEDRTAGYQVWNQPVLGYRILEERTLTEAEAITLLKGKAGEAYAKQYNSPEVKSWRYVKMDTDYITEASNDNNGVLTRSIERFTRTDHYEMILELKGTGEVVGGEWIGYTQETHPDFLWLPLRYAGGNPNVSYGQVKQLLDLSLKTEVTEPVDEAVLTFGGDVDVKIPDNKPAGVKHTLTVADDVVISSFTAKLAIEHTYIGDLKVVLEHAGVSVTLHDKQGGGNNDINESYELSNFNGKSTKGDWLLTVTDTAARDTGSIKNLTLHVGAGTTTVTPDLVTVSNTTPVAIPDEDAKGISSAIAVTDTGTIKGLKLTVDVTHTYIGDVTISLMHDGQTQAVHTHEGGSADDIKKSFTYSTFNGSALKGNWSLAVIDDVGGDTGTLNSWSLEFTR